MRGSVLITRSILLAITLVTLIQPVEAFTRVSSLKLNNGEGYLASAVIDTSKGYAYFGANTSPGAVVKIDLNNFTRVGSLNLSTSYPGLGSAVIDTARGFAYFGTEENTGYIVKVRLSDLTLAGTLHLSNGVINLFSAVIDTSKGYAYFGGYSDFGNGNLPGLIVRIRLSDFTEQGSITLNASNPWLQSAIIDTNSGYAYFGTYYGSVVKIRLSDFTWVDTLSFCCGNADSAVIDALNGFAYFGDFSGTNSYILKIRLSNFTLVNSLALNTSTQIGPLSAVINPSRNYALFGLGTHPGTIVKIRLSDFTEQGNITLNNGENELWSAVLDPYNAVAYFGTYTNPGIVVKVAGLGSLTVSPFPAVPVVVVTLAVAVAQRYSGPRRIKRHMEFSSLRS